MDCINFRKSGAETLLDYCAGTLDPARTAEIEKHIQDCGACMRVVEVHRELWATLDSWHAPAVSDNFDARLYSRIAAEDAAPVWSRWLRRLLEPPVPYAIWKPAALAAACAVLATGLLINAPHAPGQASQMVQMDSDRVDIEQVANALEELDLLTPSTSSASSM